MAKEDPLERIAREEAEREQRAGSLRPVIWVLAIIALALAGALAYIWMQKNSLVGALEEEKQDLTVQIDSLNTLNHKLTADLNQARKEADEQGRKNAELSEKVSDLSNRVAVGSVIKARGVSLTAYNASEKATDRSSRVVRMVVGMTLIENDLAAKGPVRVYVRVKDPEGFLLQDGSNASFSFEGSALPATASREIDYQGSDVEISVYVNNIESYVKGVYTVEAYTAQGLLGKAETLLR